MQNNQIMKKIRLSLVIAIFSVCAASCGVYHPQSVDIPLIEHKGDLRIDGTFSMSDGLEAKANATVSYGLFNHVAVQAFGDVGEKGRYYTQGAAGLYFPFGVVVTELYAGVGHGFGFAEGQTYIQTGSEEDKVKGRLTSDYNLPFLQLNLGVLTGAGIDLGAGFKCGYILNLSTDDNYYAKRPEGAAKPVYNEQHTLLEPTIFIRFGGDKVKFSIRLGATFLDGEEKSGRHFPYHSYALGAGVNFRL